MNQRTENSERKGDDLAERLLVFADRVLRICRDLRQDVPGGHVARQLIRSASAGGAIYEEARGAESRADFVHKIGIATKEARESLYWLKLIDRAELVASGRTARAHLDDTAGKKST